MEEKQTGLDLGAGHVADNSIERKSPRTVGKFEENVMGLKSPSVAWDMGGYVKNNRLRQPPTVEESDI